MVNLKVSILAFMVSTLLALTGAAQPGNPLNLSAQTVTIAQGQTVTLHATSVNGVTFQWVKNGSYIPNAIQNTYIVSTEGVYQVMSFNLGNCTSGISDPVAVNIGTATTSQNADVAISITSGITPVNINDVFNYAIMVKNNGPVTATGINVQDNLPYDIAYQKMEAVSKGDAVFSDFSKNITWKIDQLTMGETASMVFTVKALKAGTINNTTTVTSETIDNNLANNVASTTDVITSLIIPNVFTPNGDGLNDNFEVPGLASYSGNELTVMNRWGSTVYQKKDYKDEWTGEGLNEGTYFYLLKVQTNTGRWDVYKGYVTLLRAKLN